MLQVNLDSEQREVYVMKKTICITGKGTVTVSPDTICMLLAVEETKESYEEALAVSVKANQEIKSVFVNLGFDEKEIKTSSFHIIASYEDVRRQDMWQKIFKGYKYSQLLKVKFGLDHKLVGKILKGLSMCSVHPEFQLEYTVKDKETVKNKLLEDAVDNSKMKANVLASAAGLKLGEVKSIDYSWGKIQISNKLDGMIDYMALSEDDYFDDEESISYDVQPEDIIVTDNVTIMWELK